MNSERWEKIKAILFDSLEQDLDQRAAFLDAACAGDSALRKEVEDLLVAQDASGRLRLESRLIADEPDDISNGDAMLGARVASYRVKRLIGQGGMGSVYLAERHDDYAQQVALKIIRPGVNSADVTARFRAERQILAQLQHPNIARLLDGGMTEEGQPYLVMEYVEGTPSPHFVMRIATPSPSAFVCFGPYAAPYNLPIEIWSFTAI